MRLDLIEYETVADAAPVDAGDAAPVDAAPADLGADTAVDDAAAVDAAPVAADPFADLGIDPEDLRELAGLAPVLRQVLNAPAPQDQQGEQQTAPQFTLDPFADDFGQNLVGILEQILDQRIQPIQGHFQQEAQQRSQELLKDALHDTEQRLGEFSGGDQSRQMFETLTRQQFAEVSQRYGQTDRASEIAMERAHSQMKAWEESIAKSAVEQHVNRNAKLAGVHGEPGLGSGSGVETMSDRVLSPRELALKYGNKAAALRG